MGSSYAMTPSKPGKDQLVLIHVEGMHCHKCENAITKAISAKPGVHEVEVDFNSKQASVLFDPGSVSVGELMTAVNDAGYRAVSFSKVAAESMQ
jgi:copper chaperone CopZ